MAPSRSAERRSVRRAASAGVRRELEAASGDRHVGGRRRDGSAAQERHERRQSQARAESTPPTASRKRSHSIRAHGQGLSSGDAFCLAARRLLTPSVRQDSPAFRNADHDHIVRLGLRQRRSTTSAARSPSSASARPTTPRRRDARRKQIAAQATERALADAGLDAADIDGLMYIPFSGDQFDAAAFRAHFGTSHDMWVSTKGGGMVWAGSAPYDAALAIRAGKATYVLNIFSVAWATQRPQMVGGPGQVHAEDLYKQNLEVPFGWFPQPVYFATIARRHMHEFGTTPEQLGAIAVACRRHANLDADAR